MRLVKSRSSAWMHEAFPALTDFAWQEGYSAFSVSKSQEVAVKTYIANQKDHHARHDFRSELSRIFEAHGVEFNEKYVFD